MKTLQNKIAGHGLGTPSIACDGEIHRFKPPGSKSASGWYICHDCFEYQAGAFGCWKQGICERFFQSKTDKYSLKHKLAYEAHNRMRIFVEKQRTQARNSDALEHIYSLWKSSPTCNKHPYLDRKKIQGLDLRVDRYGNLLIPMFDVDNILWNIQKINPDGSKYFSKGARVKGCFYPIVDLINGLTFILCEGFATGASIRTALGLPTVVCFNAGNLLQVGQEIAKKYPDAKLVFAGDNDQYSSYNTGKNKAIAAAASTGGTVVLPRFASTGNKPTDFNDLHQLEGIYKVKQQLMAACYAV
jgi:putative DNA primase/helicase